MSSKLGLILSMLFVALTFLFGADLITIQAAYSSLESDASDIAYYLSKNGYTSNFNSYFDTYYGDKGITFEITDYSGVNYDGEVVSFVIRENLSLFLLGSSMNISVASTAMVGYYG